VHAHCGSPNPAPVLPRSRSQRTRDTPAPRRDRALPPAPCRAAHSRAPTPLQPSRRTPARLPLLTVRRLPHNTGDLGTPPPPATRSRPALRVPTLAVPPPCSHHCAQARQPRCRVTRIVNSAVISATPRCTPTPASCPATVATIDGGRLEPRAAAAPLAYKRQGRVALHRHDELSPSHPTPPALLALLLHKETSLLSISSCRQPRTKVSSCRAAPQHPRPSPTSAPSSARHQRAHKPRPCSKLSNRNPLALLFLPVCSVSCIVARAVVRQAGEAWSASHGGRA
jgi:hypothetical protein